MIQTRSLKHLIHWTAKSVLLSITLSLQGFADVNPDRGYDIPRTPRLETGEPYVYMPVKIEYLNSISSAANKPTLRIVYGNDGNRAICLPQFHLPYEFVPDSDILSVFDEATGSLLQYKETEGGIPDYIDDFRVVPPGWATEYYYYLFSRYDLTPGKTYRIKYSFEAFYCDALNDGYPAMDLLYKYEKQVESDLPIFERSPATTVKIFAEYVFKLASD